MPRNLLSEVNVVAISLVDKGANRKRFFLRKQDDDEELFDLPGGERLVKTDDWSSVYCVVAEPGWEENPGRGASESGVSDVWKDSDEIRQAAHRFMNNGGLVNKMHETLDPYGKVVENFIAPTDFTIDGEVIKSGSWVVAIQPSDEGRTRIEEGEFTGVSIQGSGTRELQKGEYGKDPKKQGPHGKNAPVPKKCPNCGATMKAGVKTCPNCHYTISKAVSAEAVSQAHGPILRLVSYYMKKPHPWKACYQDQIKHGLPPEMAAARCARLKDIGHGGNTSWRGKTKKRDEIFLEGLAKQMSESWVAQGLSGEDATMLLKSMEANENETLLKRVAQVLGLSEDEDGENGTVSKGENDVSDKTKDTQADERLTKMEESVTKTAQSMEALANRVADIAQTLAEKSGEKTEDPAEEVYHRLEDVNKGLEGMKDSIEKLAKGGSTQPAENGKVEKSDDPLAGLLT